MATWRTPGGRTLYYDDSGDGPPLLLLIGAGGARRSLGPLARAFAPHFRVLVPEARDAGESPPEEAPYTLGDLAGDALALLDGLGIARAHVLGISMGGMVALRLVRDQPARVDHLILVATPTHVRRPAGADDAPPAIPWWVDDPVERFRGLVSALVTPATRERPTFAAELAAAADLERGSLLTLAGVRRQIMACHGHDARPWLGAVTAPTLVIRGDHDHPDDARALAAGIPRARLLLLADTSHAATIERPAEVARAVLDFLGATEERPRSSNGGPQTSGG